MTTRFGFLFMPAPPQEYVSWIKEADAIGAEKIGIGDSQSLYRDVYVALTLAAVNSKRIQIGPRVTNPITRHPAVSASAIASIDELSDGRAFFAIGTGHSAPLNIGMKPAKLADMREYVGCMRALFQKGEAPYQGRTVRLTWPKRYVPIYVAGSGPKALRLAGEIGDGVVIGCGISRSVAQEALSIVAEGARASGRELKDLDVWFYIPSAFAEDTATAQSEVRGSVVSGSHAYFYGGIQGRGVPKHLEDKVRQLVESYRVDQHIRPNQSQDNYDLIDKLGLREYLVDRFAIAGGPKDVAQRIRDLASWGVTNIWMSLHAPDKVRTVRVFGRKVLPLLGDQVRVAKEA